MQCEVLIVGAGLTGLSIAYHLERLGLSDYLLIEAQERPGGWAKTDWWGHYGADRAIHVLYFRNEHMREWVAALLEGNWRSHVKRCLIDSGGVRTSFPFHANLHGRPIEVIEDCLLGLWRASLERERGAPLPVTFDEWIRQNFGLGVGRHFMDIFNTKMWTVPPTEMGCDWISDFIPAVDPGRILAGALRPHDSRIGLNATFHYPRKGISQLSDALAARINPDRVRYGSSLVRLLPGDHLAVLDDGTRIRHSLLVSTIPLKVLAGLLQPLPPLEQTAWSRLESLDLVLVDVGLKDPDVRDVHWVYLPDADVLPYRLHLCHALSEELAPPGHGLYCIEITHSRHRLLPIGDLRRRIIADLIRTGWLRSESQVTFYRERRFPCAYVLPRVGFKEDAAILRTYLERRGIRSAGRYGEWKYATMEDALCDGQAVAQAIARQPWPAAI